MDEKEDGEVSDGNEGGFSPYKPVVRPDASLYRQAARHMPSSDEDYSSDSDSDSPSPAKRKRPNISKMETSASESLDPRGWMDGNTAEGTRLIAKPRRRNTVWSTVMEEQVLSQEIGGFGLKRRLDKGDRNVESYDYTQALKLRGILPDESDEEGEESEQLKEKRMNRKRHVKERLGSRKSSTDDVRELIEVTLTDAMTDEEAGLAIADGLLENKSEIIVRVVQVLGREKALELYKETRQVELEGGLMILDGSRRRTSGGVYMQLIKKLPGVEKADIMKIFPQEESRSSQQWRKRKRVHRKRERHESKPQGEEVTEEGLHIDGLFSDDPGGAKCPGSTPVTSPQPSDNEEENLAGSTINQLSPPSLPEPSTSPPALTDPRAFIPNAAVDTFNGGFLNIEANPVKNSENRSAQIYDEDFLDVHGQADEMDLF